jgi:hypothetical protein
MVSEDDAFALYCFSRRISQTRRAIVNSQVVVVGASECGISAIEQLLCSSDVEFTSITLIAPGGITVGGAGSTYSSQDISKIGLEAQVRFACTKLVGSITPPLAKSCTTQCSEVSMTPVLVVWCR